MMPQNVEVVAGNDVTLHCEVANQQGNAQWTRDGFALGKWIYVGFIRIYVDLCGFLCICGFYFFLIFFL